jgi:AcrR family transcriptional regulator
MKGRQSLVLGHAFRYDPAFREKTMEPADLLDRCYPGRRAESKRLILRSALALFNQHGVEATTIEHIRSDSEMSVGAIYHHFVNKEGLVAALYMAALEDQGRLRDDYVGAAQSAESVIHALVHSYVDWVTQQPEWARFQFQARYEVAKSAFGDRLLHANQARNAKLRAWYEEAVRQGAMQEFPLELLLSLIIGSTENYCRAWLSGRVKNSPDQYRAPLAEAAWRTVRN